jgi:hypothetical protein
MRAILLVILLSALLIACGQEQPLQTRVYHGKADTAPWDSPESGGAQAEWEGAIKDRTANQNEYARTR